MLCPFLQDLAVHLSLFKINDNSLLVRLSSRSARVDRSSIVQSRLPLKQVRQVTLASVKLRWQRVKLRWQRVKLRWQRDKLRWQVSSCVANVSSCVGNVTSLYCDKRDKPQLFVLALNTLTLIVCTQLFRQVSTYIYINISSIYT